MAVRHLKPALSAGRCTTACNARLPAFKAHRAARGNRIQRRPPIAQRAPPRRTTGAEYYLVRRIPSKFAETRQFPCGRWMNC